MSTTFSTGVPSNITWAAGLPAAQLQQHPAFLAAAAAAQQQPQQQQQQQQQQQM